MKMSSLVAYDDSESENELFDQKEENTSAPVQTLSCEQTQEAAKTVIFKESVTFASDQKLLQSEGSSSSSRFYSQPQPCTGWERNSWSESALHLPATQGEALQTPSCIPDEPNPAKRLPAVVSSVRPYVPKRQRLSVETLNPKQPSAQVQGDQTRKSQILSEASPQLKPYLSEKPRAAGIPRKLQKSLEGHQGAVNMMQWCPVPHLSHLLLSASMDKTFKVWDGAESGRCLRLYTCHSGAVRAACWTPCGRQLLTGSFDNTAVITDVETGQQVVKVDNQFKVMCVAQQPSSPDVFLCGGYSSEVKAWDSRCCKVVKAYKAGIQQTLDILFLRGGGEFITTTDCVSRDSADRTLIAWDYQTTAKVSNQIYHERYTCPSLALHPQENSFVAQTNGNYVALFCSQKPYRMNKRRRFEGHKVINDCDLREVVAGGIHGRTQSVQSSSEEVYEPKHL